MAATIRLARHGGRKSPFYRIVVADSRAPRNGRCVEQVGFYDPSQATLRLELRADRVEEWIRRGARPSATVAQLIKKHKLPKAS